MEIKYYLNGTQVNPDDLGGKSGHLKIEVAYKNNVKNKTKSWKQNNRSVCAVCNGNSDDPSYRQFYKCNDR